MNNFTYTNFELYDLSDHGHFIQVALHDNAECITLKPDPSKHFNYNHFASYCIKRSILYYLIQEVAGVTHYHGVMVFPDNATYKKFQRWFNINSGFLHRSRKGDINGWYNYCHKEIMNLQPGPDYEDEAPQAPE